jgi:ATP/maltotriose-dependent transcriptional regulator MalT
VKTLNGVGPSRSIIQRRSAVIEVGEETLVLLQETGDVYLAGFVHHNLGLAAWYQGDCERAERLCDEALRRFQKHRAAADALEVRISIGLLALDVGQYERARAIFAECLATARESEIRWLMGTLLEATASVAAGQGEAERAVRLFGGAEAERRLLNTPLRPALQSLYQRHIALARSALGEERFLHALEQGRALPLDQSLALALEEVPLA